MPTFKSEFSLGNGKLKEVAAFQYDDTGSGALSASVLLKLGAAGFSLDGQTLTDIAVGGAGYLSNTILPTKGYVDQAVAGVTPGIPGDATYVDFTVASSAGFASGQVVAMGTSELDQADANDAVLSNAVGVVIGQPNGTTVRVQVDGQATLYGQDLSAFDKGDLVWVSQATAGAVASYASLLSNDYATQVGIVSDDANPGKIILQQRVFGQVA
jgi:hypothetical protein